VDIHDRYAEKSAAWPKLLMIVLLIGWLIAIIWDIGILNTLSQDWKIGPFKGPFGKPFASESAKSDKDKKSDPEPTNAPSLKK
jgi:hypothetical protein